MEHRQSTDIKLHSDMWLRVSTKKSINKTLDTTASVFKRDGGFEVHRMHQDYWKCLERSAPARITAKAVEVQHERVMRNQAEIIAAAEQHYLKEV